VICDFRHCTHEATIALRFGDGTWTHAGRVNRQTYARYCDPHTAEVKEDFVTCDEQPVAAVMAGRGGGGLAMRR
jgi:hypothetical protein